jgi:NADPH-dependent curcumin reductase CurA
MTERAQRIVLASRPVGEPTLDNFRLEELPIPQPGPGQMLLRTRWLSLDPYMRGRMSDAPSYAKPVGIGDVMEGGTVGEVVTSNVSGFTKGDIVVGRTGWQTHALSDGSGLQKVDPTRAPISTAVGVLGMPGMTAYMGLLEIGKPAAGETVVVAAASGAAIPPDKCSIGYSSTSSAMASSPDGTERPSALAVLRLMTKSNLVDCITGMSDGFSPLSTRPV